MVFSSILFLFLFLPCVFALYLPVHRSRTARNAVLLVTSLIFYFWGEGFYTFVMIAYIVVNYGVGLSIEMAHRNSNPAAARWLTGFGVSSNLLGLVYFKYAGFFAENISRISGMNLDSFTHIHLPIGISFFAFQSISYLIDIYRRDVEASRNFLDYSMYKAFFPQLIAGPIIRYRDVKRQLKTHEMRSSSVMHGLARFCAGLAKKVVIANPMGELADQLFTVPSQDLTAPLAWTGIIAYSLQIYFDFSGYSDMAIGIGRMFGFRFLENFRVPYSAQSIKDFWRRWHISLSSWFRDYLYIPLGGNRVSALRQRLNLGIVFLLCGFWHGAEWTFVVWGLWHGLFLALERGRWGMIIEHAWRPLRHTYTLLIVALGWVFFRAHDLPSAMYFIGALFGAGHGDSAVIQLAPFLDLEKILCGAIGILFSADVSRRFRTIRSKGTAVAASLAGALSRAVGGPRVPRMAAYEGLRGVSIICLLFVSATLLASGTHNPFIYFRF